VRPESGRAGDSRDASAGQLRHGEKGRSAGCPIRQADKADLFSGPENVGDRMITCAKCGWQFDPARQFAACTRIKGGWRILHGHNDLGPRQTLSAAKHQAMHEAECDLSWERHKRRGENEQRI
jgi:hypothetical protein